SAPLHAAPLHAAPRAAPTATARSPAPAPMPAAGRVTLRFTFAAACWVDVHDASGALLYQAIAPAGSVRSFAGRAPFTVILGHVAGVAMRVGGRPAAIAAAYVNGNVARFIVGADGALRAWQPAARARP
ncbi:MAG TPA: DUF4115 domain-containing protein, partial [Steroidobacteraceae bacterium]|nr:DUF4115 domain-containing protein [Steroidobacteraceae bacterium]